MVAPGPQALVLQHLEDAVAAGLLRPGDRLPAERVLASELSVSRAAVRGALARWTAEGRAETRAGSGTVLREDGMGMGTGPGAAAAAVGALARETSPLQLIEARAALEPAVCRLAARNATLGDLERLESVLAALDGCGADAAAFTLWDARFHAALAAATRNPLMERICAVMNAVRDQAQWMAVRDEKLTAARILAYNALHRDIAAAVRARDGTAAAAAMARHMAEALADFSEGAG